LKQGNSNYQDFYEFCSNEKLGVDVSANVSIGAVELDARVEFGQELATQTNAITVLKVTRRPVITFVHNAEMKDVWRNNSALEIYKAGGNRFVSQITIGAQYTAAFQYNSTSSESKSSLLTKVQGAYHGNSASAKTAHEALKEDSSVWAQFREYMFGFTTTMYGDVDKINLIAEELSKADF
jgi:hypothetical protein